MNRRLLCFPLLGAALLFTTTSASGFGGKRHTPPCGVTTGGCGTTSGYGGPCETPGATATVSYVEQKVMVNEWQTVKEEYKYWVSEPETKKQKVMVKEMKTKEEPYKYTVNEWKTFPEKVMVKEAKTKEEPYKYTVGEWKTFPDKVKVAQSVPVVKEVEFTTYTCVPVVTKQVRTVCDWVCVPVTVTATVAPTCGSSGHTKLFGHLCAKKTSGCATTVDCGSPCETPCAQVVTYTAMQRQMVTRQVEVPVTTYQRVAHTEKRSVTTYTTAWVEKDVMVSKCVPVEKEGRRLVSFLVDVEKEVMVSKCVPVEKEGKRLVSFLVDVEKEVDVTTYKEVEKVGVHNVMKCVPVEKTVKVAVYTPAPVVVAPYSPCCATPVVEVPCGTTAGWGSAHGKLFKGGMFGGMHCCK